MTPWFAVKTHPKHESLAERGLRNQDFETYVPMHRVRRQWSDRTKMIEAPLFPGYVFCRFEAQDKLRVLTSPAVRGVVSFGRDPLPVENSEIDSIRTLISTGKPIDICPYLRAGEYVCIQSGPFASVRGFILRVQDNWRVVVAIEALGCSVSVEVDAAHVLPERKSPHPPKEKFSHGRLQA
jgi:transcription antitermination factor NusG